MAAMYLLHGDHGHRPRRSIMIRAGDTKDIAVSFSKKLDAPEASPHVHSLLVAALLTEHQRTAHARKRRGNNWDIIFARLPATLRRVRSCFSHHQPFEADLVRMRGHPPTGKPRGRQNCQELPLLVIDDLSRSEANSDFVGRLYEEVKDVGVSALIMVKEKEWANELVRLNGGVQILPVDQVINNPRGSNVGEPFQAAPEWNDMVWKLSDITDFAVLEGITDVTLSDGMTPLQVLDFHANAGITETTGYQWGDDG